SLFFCIVVLLINIKLCKRALRVCEPRTNWIVFALKNNRKLFLIHSFVLGIALREAIVNCKYVPEVYE
ncbi:MAG: hypothetical protein ACK55Z_28630, partial [bacterium]